MKYTGQVSDLFMLGVNVIEFRGISYHGDNIDWGYQIFHIEMAYINTTKIYYMHIHE